MATIALAIIGNAILPGAGGFVGAFAGGLIDQYLVYPALFGQPKITGPRLDDLQLQTASEGSPHRWVLGPENRAAGSIIWEPLDANGKPRFHRVAKNHGGKGGGPKSETFTTYQSFAVTIADCMLRPINRVLKIWADSKLVFEASTATLLAETSDYTQYDANEFFGGVTIYKGTPTQPQDPIIVADKGADETPAYRYTAYAVYKDFGVDSFGRIPSMTHFVEADDELSVAQAITDVMTRAGYDASEFDVTRVYGCVRGFIIGGPQNADEVLGVLLQAFAVSVQEYGGKLWFISKGKEKTWSVSETHLAAHEGDSDTPRPFLLRTSNPLQLPREVNVSFSDAAFDYQQATQREQRLTLSTDVVMGMTWPLTFRPVEARNIARRIIYGAEAEMQVMELQLPPSYVHVDEGDALSFTAAGEPYLVRIAEITRGNDFTFQVKAVPFQQHIYKSMSYVLDESGTGQTTTSSAELTSLLLNLPALQQDQVERGGFYFAVCAADPEARWPGSKLYESLDNVDYTEVADVASEGMIGYAETALAEASSSTIDVGNTVDVVLLEGELESVTETQMLEGSNRALLGAEIIGYKTATLLGQTPGGANRYRLSVLLRGLRGTEDEIPNHASNERFLALVVGATGFFQVLNEDIGSTKYYKTPAVGQALGEAVPTTMVLEGATLRPFSPIVTLTRENGMDLRIEWDRRSRGMVDPFSANPNPFFSGEVPERWEIDIVRGGILSTVVKRTIVLEGTGVENVIYQSNDISSSASDNSINISTGSFLTRGFRVGQYVTIQGFNGSGPNTPTTREIISVTDHKMIVSGTLGTEASGDSVTLIQGRRYLYTTADQDADFGSSGGQIYIRARVYQISSQVGRGVAGQKAVP